MNRVTNKSKERVAKAKVTFRKPLELPPPENASTEETVSSESELIVTESDSDTENNNLPHNDASSHEALIPLTIVDQSVSDESNRNEQPERENVSICRFSETGTVNMALKEGSVNLNTPRSAQNMQNMGHANQEAVTLEKPAKIFTRKCV